MGAMHTGVNTRAARRPNRPEPVSRSKWVCGRDQPHARVADRGRLEAPIFKAGWALALAACIPADRLHSARDDSRPLRYANSTDCLIHEIHKRISCLFHMMFVPKGLGL